MAKINDTKLNWTLCVWIMIKSDIGETMKVEILNLKW
jgi:hypothetical protein